MRLTWLAPTITLGGNVLSDQFESITIESTREELDATTFGTRAMEYQKGRFENRVTGVFKPSSWANWKLVADMYAADTDVELKVRYTSAAIGTENPELNCQVQVTSIPFGGEGGQLVTGDVVMPAVGKMEMWFAAAGATKTVLG